MPGNIFKRYSQNNPVIDLMKEKTDAIDYAFRQAGVKSFADLGGVWGVDGGYTFYALDNYSVEKCFLVDLFFTRNVQKKKKHLKQLNLIQGDFGSQDTIRQIPELDTLFLFDVLLHQVDPDWQDILRMYSTLARCFIIYNPQYVGSETVRLLDLGEEGYFENVPHQRNEEPYVTIFKKPNEINPQTGEKYSDDKGIWQWGIVDEDLTGFLKELGYDMIYFKNYGQWGSLINFEGHAFIFQSH